MSEIENNKNKTNKRLERKQEDQNMLNAWKAGNVQNDQCYAEDNNITNEW